MIRRLIPLVVVLIAAGTGPGCRMTVPVDVRLSLPGVSPFAPDAFTTVLVAGFRDEAPFEEFRPAPALEEALTDGLRREFKPKNVSVARAALPAVPGSDDAAAWKRLGAAEPPGTVYLAGSIKLTADIRKALDRHVPVDGPFNLVGRLLAKRRWRLAAEIYVISAATGETLHHETLDEYQDYGELDKPAEFAFSELSDRVLERLYQVLCGRPTIEVRTLLKR